MSVWHRLTVKPLGVNVREKRTSLTALVNTLGLEAEYLADDVGTDSLARPQIITA